jgi:hypothetical protein
LPVQLAGGEQASRTEGDHASLSGSGLQAPGLRPQAPGPRPQAPGPQASGLRLSSMPDTYWGLGPGAWGLK